MADDTTKIKALASKPPPGKCASCKKLEQLSIEDESLMTLASPVLATNLLYWACMFTEISANTVKEILELTECYPEAPVDIDKCFSPIHAASMAGPKGTAKKLELLLKDYSEKPLLRYGMEK